MRWHNHKEYELHLIVASSGKVFVGDYVGNFGPNSLFLTGPHLPHNWISQVEEGEVVAKRDMLVNFTDEMLEAGHSVFSELRSFTPMLERSRYGIEFRCPSTIDQAGELMQRIADSRGATRLGYFLIMLELLARCDDYQLLSGATSAQLSDEHHADRTNMAVNYIFEHYMRELPLEEVASHPDETHLLLQARHRPLLCRVRQQPAHQQVLRAVARSGQPVTDVCFESGFNNLSISIAAFSSSRA